MSSGHSQILFLSHGENSCKIKSGSGLGMRLHYVMNYIQGYGIGALGGHHK